MAVILPVGMPGIGEKGLGGVRREQVELPPGRMQFLAIAIRELTATARPIWDIADALGFSSQFYFTNFFKKHTGMTPSEYRKVYSP